MRPIDVIKAAALAGLLVATAATVAVAEDQPAMFKAPNDETAVLYKYFDSGNSFMYCFQSYNVTAKKFKEELFCVRKNAGRDYVYFDTDKLVKDSNDLSVLIRYNTYNQGIIDRTYSAAPGADGEKTVFIANPEDRQDIVHLLLNSKDVILFYKTDDSGQYEMMYYPMPSRMKDGKLPMVEAK